MNDSMRLDDDVTLAENAEQADSNGLRRPSPAVPLGPSDAGRAAVSSETEPTTLGRHRVIERLGAGGMGVVYRAHDPELARDVAIKRLHAHAARSEAARARLRQEARALAEVSHPNVVQVYDVGEDHGSIYLSMELVPGIDLRQWLDQGPRPWREVLALFLTAGRGLVAAHDRGLVHRDFKPSNVLVGDDGRPRVVDFGLACLADDTITAPMAASQSLRSGTLTETGVALGTPAYMAPEQHRGQSADARSDQYAFCVSVYEGLLGERPFLGSTLQELVAAKEHPLPQPRRGSGVPRRVLAVLVRGMQPDRERRWSSMSALLVALERAAAPRRGLAWAGGAAVLLATGGIAAAYTLGADRGALATGCPSAQERLAGVWDEARADALRQAFERSALPYAGATWTRVRSQLDDYAAQWGERYGETCAQQARTHEGSDAAPPPAAATDPAALDRRMLCLSARRDELATLVEVLASGEEQAVRAAVSATAALRPVSSCDGPQGQPPADGPRKAVADEIRRELVRAESLGKVARYADGLALAEAALERAASAELPSLRAEALLVTGQLHKASAQPEPALRELSEAALLAVEVDRDDVAARAAIELVDVQGAWRTSYDDALEWNRHAQAAIHRLGDDPALEARRLTALGHLELALGHIDEALTAFEASLALVQQAFGEGHPRLATAQSDLGNVLVRAGRFDEALEVGQQALAVGEQAYGPTHPEVGLMHGRLANAWIRQGNYARAVECSERAVAILEAAHGPEHPNVAAMVITLGQAEQRRGRLDRAEAAYRRALPGVAGKPNEPILHGVLSDLARDRQDHPAALEHAQRSRELREALYGPDDSMVAVGLLQEGLSLAQVGRDEDAFAAFERSRQIAASKPLPPLAQVLATAYEGRAHLYAGRPADAVGLLERALALQEQLGAEPIDRAEVRFHLVMAQWALGRTEEARAQLAVVDQELAPLGAQAEHRRRPIRAWIEREGVGYVLSGGAVQ